MEKSRCRILKTIEQDVNAEKLHCRMHYRVSTEIAIDAELPRILRSSLNPFRLRVGQRFDQSASFSHQLELIRIVENELYRQLPYTSISPENRHPFGRKAIS